MDHFKVSKPADNKVHITEESSEHSHVVNMKVFDNVLTHELFKVGNILSRIGTDKLYIVTDASHSITLRPVYRADIYYGNTYRMKYVVGSKKHLGYYIDTLKILPHSSYKELNRFELVDFIDTTQAPIIFI